MYVYVYKYICIYSIHKWIHTDIHINKKFNKSDSVDFHSISEILLYGDFYSPKSVNWC